MFFTLRDKSPTLAVLSPPPFAPAGEPFRFVAPGPLIDGELELVAPAVRWVGAMTRSSGPAGSSGNEAGRPVSRRHLLEVVGAAPRGREVGHVPAGRPPTYHYWMRLRRPGSGGGLSDRLGSAIPAWLGGRPPRGGPPTEMAGSIALRVGRGEDLEKYLGHLGYGVFPRARGRHYAERACRLVLPIAAAHGLREVWLTVNPDNRPSRRTCERLGAVYVETVALPPGHPLHLRGEREKCRYRLAL